MYPVKIEWNFLGPIFEDPPFGVRSLYKLRIDKKADAGIKRNLECIGQRRWKGVEARQTALEISVTRESFSWAVICLYYQADGKSGDLFLASKPTRIRHGRCDAIRVVIRFTQPPFLICRSIIGKLFGTGENCANFLVKISPTGHGKSVVLYFKRARRIVFLGNLVCYASVGQKPCWPSLGV